jgi:hypothetical protein
MSPDSVANKPFGDIALCLSGGGYRAATYALGTLHMLDELNLLDDVKLLSTVSGGTFTGLCYATWQSEGKTFAEFYTDFSTYLRTTNAIDKALDDLYTTPSPSGSTDLSLIRSAAKSYQECLLGKRTFKQLLEIAGENARFRELIFNATEFREGNSFRFRASWDKTVFHRQPEFCRAEDGRAGNSSCGYCRRVVVFSRRVRADSFSRRFLLAKSSQYNSRRIDKRRGKSRHAQALPERL